jgi:hypothetical protein
MQTLIYMSKDEVLERLAEITGKAKEQDDVQDQRDNPPADIDNNEEANVDDAAEAGSDNSGSDDTAASSSSSVEEFQKIFGGNIVNEFLLDGRKMTKKEYTQYCKGLTQTELLAHPLLYMLFRSEDQSQVNFFDWLNKFKK